VRKVAGYNLPNCLRITVGDEPSCRRVAHAVGRFMDGER
jgi:histidinol-phosphate aminotransferase